MHWAITGLTAAEIIHARADSDKPHMGLTNWRGAKVRKQDVTIAKNYLNQDELAALNNLVEQYLVFAEGQAMRRVPMYHAGLDHQAQRIPDLERTRHFEPCGKNLARDGKGTRRGGIREIQPQARLQQTDQAGGDFDKAIKQLPPPPKPRKKGGKKMKRRQNFRSMTTPRKSSPPAIVQQPAAQFYERFAVTWPYRNDAPAWCTNSLDFMEVPKMKNDGPERGENFGSRSK